MTRIKALESLVIAGFVRGLSTRDVEATLEEALGEQAALSKSTVSRVCSVLVDQFQLWQRRDLSDYELDYLFADATFFKYHPAAKGEPVLCTGSRPRARGPSSGSAPAPPRATRAGASTSKTCMTAAFGRRCSVSPTAAPPGSYASLTGRSTDREGHRPAQGLRPIHRR